MQGPSSCVQPGRKCYDRGPVRRWYSTNTSHRKRSFQGLQISFKKIQLYSILVEFSIKSRGCRRRRREHLHTLSDSCEKSPGKETNSSVEGTAIHLPRQYLPPLIYNFTFLRKAFIMKLLLRLIPV